MPIAGAFGVIALFAGSFQYLQKAHFFVNLTLKVKDDIVDSFFIDYCFYFLEASLIAKARIIYCFAGCMGNGYFLCFKAIFGFYETVPLQDSLLLRMSQLSYGFSSI